MTPITTACFAQFFYRVNSDKTVDAICGYCFEASDPCESKNALYTWETAHRCQHRLARTA